MEKLIRSLKGYLKIKVWGYSPERFMNLCSNRNILLWNIENHDTYYTMCISIAGFWRLRPVTKKTKTRVAILHRYGLPFFVPYMKKRSIFFLGLAGCLFFLHMMSYFIWSIEITGNSSLTTDVLMDFLEENEIVCGSRKKDLDIEALEKSIRRQFDIVTWTSARLDGTKLVIQIKENSRKTPQIEVADGEGMDLEATKKGKIVDMVTRSGVPLVKIEDEVEKGEILVSGAVPVYNEDTTIKEYLFCKADADIYLECGYHYEEKFPIQYQYKVYTGNEKKISYLRFFGRDWKLPFQKVGFDRCDCVVSENRLEPLKDFYLPVSFGNYRYREYTLLEKQYTQEQVKTLCQESLDRVIETLQEKGVQIIEKDVKIKKDSSHYMLYVDFTVVEKTGILVRTKTENPRTGEDFQETRE